MIPHPATMYGLEALVLDATCIKELDSYHRSLLRMIQTLTESTAKPAIYLLTGTLPAQAEVHKKILNLFMTILHRPGTPEYQVITRQLAVKQLDSNSWTTQLRKLLHTYKLPPALVLAQAPPKSTIWKMRVREAIETYWEKELIEDAAQMKSLKNLNTSICITGHTHPVWLTGSNPLQAMMATVRAAMLVGRYPFTGEKVAGTRQTDSCPYCEEATPETTCHFILHCALYNDIRERMIRRLNKDTEGAFDNLSEEDQVKIMIDPSHIARSEEEAKRLEGDARREVFAMHNRRAVKDGRGSMYQWAVARVREGSGVLGAKYGKNGKKHRPLEPQSRFS